MTCIIVKMPVPMQRSVIVEMRPGSVYCNVPVLNSGAPGISAGRYRKSVRRRKGGCRDSLIKGYSAHNLFPGEGWSALPGKEEKCLGSIDQQFGGDSVGGEFPTVSAERPDVSVT